MRPERGKDSEMDILIEILNMLSCVAVGALIGFFILVPFLGVA